MRHTFALALALASLPSFAAAATIDHVPMGDGVELIGIEGDIASGDEDKFSKLAVQYKTVVVALDSDGGELAPALEIGKAIHLRGYATIVGRGKTCASACALIWVAGTKRLLLPSAKVGFHASYLESNGQKIESGVANALVGRYLTQLDLPESSIIFATSAGPNSIRWLTSADEANSSIPFEVLSDDSGDSDQSTTSVAPLASTSVGGWRVVGTTDDGDVAFVNTDEIDRSRSIVQFWEDDWWGKSAAGTNRSLALIKANCNDKSYRSLKVNFYLDEKFLDSSTPPDLDYAAPGTVIFAVIKGVCASQYYTGSVVDRAATVSRIRNMK